MNWKLEFRPEVELDVREAAVWYERREEGLGSEFVEEIIRACDRRRLWTAGILIPSFVSALRLFQDFHKTCRTRKAADEEPQQSESIGFPMQITQTHTPCPARRAAGEALEAACVTIPAF